jgi:hypothetical protein
MINPSPDDTIPQINSLGLLVPDSSPVEGEPIPKLIVSGHFGERHNSLDTPPDDTDQSPEPPSLDASQTSPSAVYSEYKMDQKKKKQGDLAVLSTFPASLGHHPAASGLGILDSP